MTNVLFQEFLNEYDLKKSQYLNSPVVYIDEDGPRLVTNLMNLGDDTEDGAVMAYAIGGSGELEIFTSEEDPT